MAAVAPAAPPVAHPHERHPSGGGAGPQPVVVRPGEFVNAVTRVTGSGSAASAAAAAAAAAAGLAPPVIAHTNASEARSGSLRGSGAAAPQPPFAAADREGPPDPIASLMSPAGGGSAVPLKGPLPAHPFGSPVVGGGGDSSELRRRTTGAAEDEAAGESKRLIDDDTPSHPFGSTSEAPGMRTRTREVSKGSCCTGETSKTMLRLGLFALLTIFALSLCMSIPGCLPPPSGLPPIACPVICAVSGVASLYVIALHCRDDKKNPSALGHGHAHGHGDVHDESASLIDSSPGGSERKVAASATASATAAAAAAAAAATAPQ